ncbi:MAG: T9SS type A sorting domain-containing protein [Melioribacteraceae bacterium]|nr:T9SS type A sorting domain-containing protein [Melioribacteraceae bacterium]MCF8417359.1 T9SS type A sorting domain-containing protein [Melioribacteraceae bacterium]
MKSITFIVLLLVVFVSPVFPQSNLNEIFGEKGEIYFQVSLDDYKNIYELSKIISIDNVKDGYIFAYANKKEFPKFLQKNISYQLLEHPGDVNVEMSNDLNQITEWDVYPTYSAYVNLMYEFESSYPDLCRIVDAGNTTDGRKILFAVISDSVNVREAEPQFMYTSSMHGDEITGYVNMLRLIDSLLTSYGNDQRITELVDGIEIWINPLANPDGTYTNNDNTVTGATRGNANYIDLNRNFPDPDDGPHPDGNSWQAETLVMMDIASENHFVMSANFHGGAEVLNYPWDTWVKRHPDDAWWQYVSREYADTCHEYSPNGYMTDLNDGITNGYDWYTISGGRQDFMNYFHYCREVTIEISDIKLPSANTLPNYWEYNKRSFLNYLEQVSFGIRGIVTDNDGNPLNAKITILDHDEDNSEVYTDSSKGNYHRLIADGNYFVFIESEGFLPKMYNGIRVTNRHARTLNAVLDPIDTNEPPYFVDLPDTIRFNNDTSYALNLWEYIEDDNLEDSLLSVSFTVGNDSLSYVYEDSTGVIVFVSDYYYSGSTTFKISIDDSVNDPVSQTIDVLIDKVTGINDDEVIVNNFKLYQNYPNPFNPATKIKFSLPNSKSNLSYNTVLTVYDILGNKIIQLVNKPLSSGIYEVEFNGSELPSGIYFYTLKSGEYIQTKKALLLK